MEWLFKLEKHLCIEPGLLIISNEFKHEGLVKYGIGGALNRLGAKAAL